MPKKSARRSVAKQSNVRALHAYVRPWEMCPGSEPREHRDQRYVRKVRPKTDTQRALIEALDSYHMVLAQKFLRVSKQDVVRHPLVSSILEVV